MNQHFAPRDRTAVRSSLETHFERASAEGEDRAVRLATSDLVAAAAFLELKLGPSRARRLLIATANAVGMGSEYS